MYQKKKQLPFVMKKIQEQILNKNDLLLFEYI